MPCTRWGGNIPVLSSGDLFFLFIGVPGIILVRARARAVVSELSARFGPVYSDQ